MVTRVLLVLGLLGMATAPSCGTATGSAALGELEGGAIDVAKDCGPTALADYNDVRSAIHAGGPSWVSVLFDALGCIESVTKDELQSHGVIAHVSPELEGAFTAALSVHDDARRAWADVERYEEGSIYLEPYVVEFASNGDAVFSSVYAPAGVSKSELRRAHMAIAVERAALKLRLNFHVGAKKK